MAWRPESAPPSQVNVFVPSPPTLKGRAYVFMEKCEPMWIAGVPAVLLTYTFHAQLVSLLASFGDKMVVFPELSQPQRLGENCYLKKPFSWNHVFLWNCVRRHAFSTLLLPGAGAMNLCLKFKRPSCWNCRALSISMTNVGVSFRNSSG